MDFFASQELARRNTRRLIFYFGLAVLSMIAGIYLVVLFATGATKMYNQPGEAANWVLLDPLLLGIVALSVIVVVGFGSLYKVSALSGGGESVAAMFGGRRLPPNSRDPAERKILNVVEEMALAAGTPVPPVYVLDDEPGINAFAAGYTIDDAVIGINRGTIEILSRDELQGVVAHEFSHILNGDMRMSIRLIGVLHGIQILALIGYYVLRGGMYAGHRRSGDNKGGGAAILIIALGLIVIGSLGLLFARLIKASISRQREYLADASAVQFTRNPDGIAGALKMIGAEAEGSMVHNPHAEETSHMFFASMFKSNFVNLFATHPPLEKRIASIDPRFDGDFQDYARARMEKKRRREEARQKKEQPRSGTGFKVGFPGMDGSGGVGFPEIMGDQFPIDPLLLIAGIGLPDDDDVEYSAIIVDRIPDELAVAARDVFSARCLVFATLLNPAIGIRREQLQAVASGEGQATIDETIRLMPMVDDLEARFRLPLFEILQGTLTGMSPEQYDSFRMSVDRLVDADKKVDLFEFFLRHHLIVHLDRRFGKISPPRVKYRTMTQLRTEICQLLAILARVGHADTDAAEGAFRAGIDSIDQPWHDQVTRIDEGFKYKNLATALEHMNQASPKIKKRLLTAMAVAITYDKKVTVEEAELFRAMSESLDCPVPPVVASVVPSNEPSTPGTQ